MRKTVIIQNVTPNHHHAVYIDGFVRELNKGSFETQVLLQKTDQAFQFKNIPYKMRLLPGKTYSPIGQIQFILAAINELRRIQPDLVHAHNPFSSLVAPLVLRRKGSPKIIYDVRGLWVEFGIHAGYFPPLVGRMLMQFDRYLMQRCDYVIAISPLLKEVLIRKGVPKDRIGVVPGGVDLQKFDSAIKFDYKKEYGWDGPVLGYVASISTARSSQDVLYAFKKAMEILNTSRVYLAMIGPVAQPEYFEELVRQLSLDDNVIFTGFVPHDQIPDYIKGFDIALSYFPEKDQPNINVSVPYKLLEYLAAGIPMIVTDQICHTSIVQDGVSAVVIQPSIESLATGLIKAIENPDLANIGHNAREKANDFSFNAIARKIEAIYHHVQNM